MTNINFSQVACTFLLSCDYCYVAADDVTRLTQTLVTSMSMMSWQQWAFMQQQIIQGHGQYFN